eukprot:scaffold3127_cov202-Prasinococcus_capsulatus_cf.AAC.8
MTLSGAPLTNRTLPLGGGFALANDASAAQSLHGGQLTDNGVLLGHLARAQRQARRDDCGQALRDCCHRQGHGNLEVERDIGNGPPAALPRQKLLIVDQPHEKAHYADHLRQQLAKGIELLLQRRVTVLGGGLLAEQEWQPPWTALSTSSANLPAINAVASDAAAQLSSL